MIIPELLTGIATDLHQITNRLAWAHTQAWWPTSRPLDAPTGRPLPPPPDGGEHVKAMCQGCHLHYDSDHHRQTREATRAAAAAAAGQGTLPLTREDP